MMRKVLIVNIFGIGDVLFTTPIIKSIKAYSKDIKIGYLCNHRTREILENDPDVDDVFVYNRDAFNEVYYQSKIEFVKKISAFLGSIKEKKYDALIDLSLNFYVSFFCWLIGIKRRIGFDYKKRSPFLNKKVDLHGYEQKHVVEYYSDLLKEIGVPLKSPRLNINIKKADRDWAHNFLAQKGINPKGIMVGLVPGGGQSWGKDAAFKRWPSEKYAKLADKLIEKFSAEIILLGNQQEEPLCREVSSCMRNPSYSVCGMTTITQFAALAAECSVVVLNDGGPLHIAVAAGARTVSIFGPVNEDIYGPYPRGNHHIITNAVACRPCYRKFRKAACTHFYCLNKVLVEDVLFGAEEVLASVSVSVK